MIRKTLPLLFVGAALLVAPVVVRPAAQSSANVYARDLGSGELVAKVINKSGHLQAHRRVYVVAGDRRWAINVPDDTPVMLAGRMVSMHDLTPGTYVRATGERIGDTRLKADHIYIIGDRLALRRTGYYRVAGYRGYFTSTAGYRSNRSFRR